MFPHAWSSLEELERAKSFFQRLGAEEPEIYKEGLKVFARGATAASEGQLLHIIADEKLTGPQKRKKIDTCLQQAGAWGGFAQAAVKKAIHPTVMSHAMACAMKA